MHGVSLDGGAACRVACLHPSSHPGFSPRAFGARRTQENVPARVRHGRSGKDGTRRFEAGRTCLHEGDSSRGESQCVAVRGKPFPDRPNSFIRCGDALRHRSLRSMFRTSRREGSRRRIVLPTSTDFWSLRRLKGRPQTGMRQRRTQTTPSTIQIFISVARRCHPALSRVKMLTIPVQMRPAFRAAPAT